MTASPRPRRRFRPTLWATVAVLPALALLLGLGVWQLQRLEWKTERIAEMTARMTGPPIALPDPLPQGEALDALRFRRVTITGVYHHDRELYRGAQSLRNQRGAFVLTPMTLDDGRQVVVNRGWVPLDRKDPATRPKGLVEGRVTVAAIVRFGGWRGLDWLRPANDPAANVWLWMDLDRMAQAADLAKPVPRLYLDAVEGQHPGRYPIGGQTRVNLRNQHLSYALTWFALAGGLLAIYVLYHLRPTRRGDDEKDA